MNKTNIISMEFSIKYKETNLPIKLDELLEEEWAQNLIKCDIDDFYLSSDGQLILADECGNFSYVPREEKFIVNIFIGNEIFEMIY